MKIWVLNPPFLKKYSRPQRSPAVTKSGTLYFPIWLAYCAGVLEKAGHDVTLTDAPATGLDLQDILQQAATMKPRLIVLDTSTPSIRNDLNVAADLKKTLPDSFVVMVGTHVSAMTEETLGNGTAVDAIARREYEFTIRELAAALEGGKAQSDALRKVSGLSFRDGGRIVHNPDRPFIENLDELPWVSRVYKKSLQIRDYFNPNALYPMVTLTTSRGCPFRCTFCVYPQTFTGRKSRFRSIEDVLGEMEFVAKEFPDAKSIFFEDDTLTANKKRCMEFADAIIARGLKIPWTANSRIDLDLEGLKKISAAGCRQLCVGFESGDQDVLNGMRKGTTTEKMLQFMSDAKQAGILVHGCFMLGFPGETRENVEKTIELAIKLNPDTVQFYPVMVYPGTEAYDQYKGKGWLTARDYSEWLTPEGLHNCVVRNELFTSEELVRLCDLARRRFYLRPRYIAYKAMQMIAHPGEIGRTAKAARTFAKHLLRGSKV
jgi:anaerobic magnesium-protoporphyrin IX monomethyl ester cyclase